MAEPEAAIRYIERHQSRFLAELKALCAIPSVSTLPEHKSQVEQTARWLATELNHLSMKRVEVLPTGGHPVVYGEWLEAPGRPVALVYGHYDVQPADPLDAWESPPFEPAVREDNLYARGASDMKGQIIAIFKAVEALEQTGGVPVNLKFLLEGEEEIGSPHLEAFIEGHKDLLTCDFVLNCDGGIHAPDLPSLTYGLRGLAYFELEVRGPSSDLHSGVFGGAVHNPAQVLCELIAAMHDVSCRVTLPGFYDKVRPLDAEERGILARLPLADEDWKRLTGVPAVWGEADYTILERIGARPTLEVNGIGGGFTGEGAKTVLPAKALAKISMRLVPDQEPREVAGQLRAFLETRAPATVAWELREMTHAAPALLNRHSPYMQAAARVLEETFGTPPVFKRDGGTVPVVSLVQNTLGVDTVLLGFELPDAGFHGPNEKLHVPTFFKGIEVYVRFLAGL